MPNLDKPTRRIDARRGFVGGGSILESGGEDASPAIALPPAPRDLAVTSIALVRSDLAPTAVANLKWTAPRNVPISAYVIQWSTSAAFTNPVSRDRAADKDTAAIDGLPTALTASTIYFRIASMAPSGLVGAYSAAVSVAAPADTTPPATVSSAAFSWANTGALALTWVNPTSPNFLKVRIRFYDTPGGTLLAERFATRGGYTLELGDNQSLLGGPRASFHVVLTALSIGGLASSDVTLSPSKARPGNVTANTPVWDGERGACGFSWSSVTGAVRYDLTIDGKVYQVTPLQFTYSLAQNRADHSGTADPALSWSIVAVDALGQTSVTPASGTATLARPATPSGMTSTWASDAGTADEAATFTWTLGSGIVSYILTIDGVARQLGLVNRYGYSYVQNQQEHSGVADPSLTVSLVAVDALGQTSATPASLTATNVAPPATTVSVFGAFDSVQLTIAPSAALDLLNYRVRVYKDGSGTPVDTFYTTNTRPFYQIESGNGSYRFDVAVFDRFNQVSTTSALTAALTLLDRVAFIADLRSRVVYHDSVSTSPDTLKGLKDTDTGVTVVVYTSSTPWRWTEAVRGFEDRHYRADLSTSASAQFYYGVSSDGITYTWYAGGTATGGVWSPIAQASEAAAQAAATTLAGGMWRLQLPATVEGRYFRLGHRNTSASYGLREFYPRSSVDADDIRAETLAAISANLGTIVAGTLLAVSITGATITGGTIQTAASGARAELTSAGLKTYSAAGVVQVEATTATNGALKAGTGSVVLDASGLSIVGDVSYSTSRAIRWTNSAGSQLYASIFTLADEFSDFRIQTPSSNITIEAGTTTGTGGTAFDGSVRIQAKSATGTNPQQYILVDGGYTGGVPKIAYLADEHQFTGPVNLLGALSVGSAGATVGGVTTIERSTAATNVAASALILDHKTSGSVANGFGVQMLMTAETTTTEDQNLLQLAATWATAADATRKARAVFSVYDTAAREALRLEASGTAPMIGFLGNAAVARPVVTGSRGGNAALASFLTALDTLGLITNSTTA